MLSFIVAIIVAAIGFRLLINVFFHPACNPNPCNNGGTCADANDDGTPECTCAEGFVGDTCDIHTGKDSHTKLE